MQQKRKDPYSSQGHETGQSQFEAWPATWSACSTKGPRPHRLGRALERERERVLQHGRGDDRGGQVARRGRAPLGRRSEQARCRARRALPQLCRSVDRSVRRFLGETVEPVVEPEPGDNRFKDPDWSNTQFFDFWKQAYRPSLRAGLKTSRATPKASTTRRARRRCSI